MVADATAPAVENNKVEKKGDGSKEVDPKQQAAAVTTAANDKLRHDSTTGQPPTGSDGEKKKDGGDQGKEKTEDEPWYTRYLHQLQDEGAHAITAVADFAGLHDVQITDPEHPELTAARTDDTRTAAAGSDGRGTGIMGTLSDAADWVANTSVGKAVTGEASALKSSYIDPVVDWFGDEWNQWYANPTKTADKGDDTVGNKPDMFSFFSSDKFQDSVNGKDGRVEKRAAAAQAKFEEQTDVSGAAPLSDANGGKIKLPDDAKDTGEKVHMGNQDLSIRRSGKDTYLVNKDGEVVAKSNPNGTYEFMMHDKDGKPAGKMDVKIEKGADGKYSVNHLERYDKNGRLTNKMEDGALLNYTYGKDGKFLGVDGLLDMRDQKLSSEQLQQRLEHLQKQLGDHGQALVRAQNEQGEHVRLHVQNLGDDTHVISDMDHRRADIWKKGTHYRLNSQGELGAVGKDGQWHELSPEQRQALNNDVRQHLMEKLRLAQQRVEGDETVELDHVRHRKTADGDDVFERMDPSTNKPASTLAMPSDDSKPMVQINNNTGERSTTNGPQVDVTSGDGTPIWNFDPDKGLVTPEYTVTDGRFIDNQTGNWMDPQGDLYDPSGTSIFNASDWDANNDDGTGTGLADKTEIAVTQTEIAQAQTYGSQAASLAATAMSSISVQNAEMYKGIVLDALGLVNSVDPDHDNLTAMLILQGPKAYCYDALSALDVGSNVVSKASAAGLNDSGYDLDNMVRTASLSVSGNDVAVLDQYRQRRLQEKGSQSGTA